MGTTIERCPETARHACDICTDGGCDVRQVTEINGKRFVDNAWHIACVRDRAENPNNSREARGMANLMSDIRKLTAKANAA